MRPIRSKLDPRVDLLRQLPPLRHLAHRDLSLLAAAFDEVRLPVGALLTREGWVGEDCYLILEGRADVIIGGVLVADAGPGEFVGEMALLSGAPRSATVRATTPMHVLTMHKSTFGALLEHKPVARTLLARLTERLRRAEGAPERFAARG